MSSQPSLSSVRHRTRRLNDDVGSCGNLVAQRLEFRTGVRQFFVDPGVAQPVQVVARRVQHFVDVAVGAVHGPERIALSLASDSAQARKMEVNR